MDAFLAEVGKKVTDRWLVSMVLPGLLFMVAVACAVAPGRHNALDVPAVTEWFDRMLDSVHRTPSGRVAVFIGVLLGAAGSALTANLLSLGIAELWSGRARRLRLVVGQVQWIVDSARAHLSRSSPAQPPSTRFRNVRRGLGSSWAYSRSTSTSSTESTWHWCGQGFGS